MTQLVLTVQPDVERGAVGSICVTEGCGAREHDLSTDIHEEVDRLAKGRAALPSGFAETGA